MNIKAIARLAGVSIGTVDRVLHDRGDVATETKERIQTIITEFGYKPNMLARHLSLNKGYVFNVLIPRADQDSGYWALSIAGIRMAAKELSSFNIDVRIEEYDRGDPGAFSALCRRLTGHPGNGLLLAPVSPDGTKELLGNLDQEIPYVFFDATVEGAKPVTEIAQDAFRSGLLAGRIMSLLTGGGSEVFAVSAHGGDPHILKRIAGFRSFFETAGNSRVSIGECEDFEGKEACRRFLREAFERKPETRGIFVSNASTHMAAEFLTAAGLKGKIALIGYDLVPANANGLREGMIDCILSQRPEYQGYKGVHQLYRKVVLGQRCEKRISIPIDVIFKENMLKQSGIEMESEYS